MRSLLRKKIITGAFVALALSLGIATPSNASEVVTPSNATVTRLSGADRYSTSDAIVKAGWSTGCDTAILASGLDANKVDALTVAPLAKSKNAPIVLVNPKDPVATIVAKFTALNTKTVYIANGTAVISTEIEKGLKDAGITTVIRLGGFDRYATALNIAKTLGSSNSIVVANGESAHLVDTLSIASIAAAKGMPILLASSSLDAATTAYINSLEVKTTYVIGGTAAVSDAVIKDLPGVIRLAGAGKYETNAIVVDTFKADAALNLNSVFIASGEDASLIDSLAGAALAALKGAPIIFTDGKDISKIKQSIDNTKYENVVILGGTAVVSQLSEDLLRGKITELDIIKSKSLYNFDMKDNNGQNYTINIFSDDNQIAEASFNPSLDWAGVWAGANEGEKLSKGHYKIAVSKYGVSDPDIYDVDNNYEVDKSIELILNLNRKLIRVHKNIQVGQPDFLIMGMPASSNASSIEAYYIENGKLKLANFIANGKNANYSYTSNSSSLFFNQKENNIFETSNYDNSDSLGFYIGSWKFDLASGGFTFLDTRFMNLDDYSNYANR